MECSSNAVISHAHVSARSCGGEWTHGLRFVKKLLLEHCQRGFVGAPTNSAPGFGLASRHNDQSQRVQEASALSYGWKGHNLEALLHTDHAQAFAPVRNRQSEQTVKKSVFEQQQPQ